MGIDCGVVARKLIVGLKACAYHARLAVAVDDAFADASIVHSFIADEMHVELTVMDRAIEPPEHVVDRLMGRPVRVAELVCWVVVIEYIRQKLFGGPVVHRIQKVFQPGECAEYCASSAPVVESTKPAHSPFDILDMSSRMYLM